MQWRVSPSFPDYEVSEYGEVRRCRKAWKGTQVGRLMTAYVRADGYRMYILRREGKSYHPRAHQLVAEAFIGPKPFDGAEVCHNDGSRNNDHHSNLRWDTRSANHLDRRAHGTIGGEHHPSAKLTANQVADVKFLRSEGYLQREIGYIVGTTQHNVSRILAGKRWAHV